MSRLALSVVTALALLASACGSSTTPLEITDSSSTTSSAPESTTTPTPDSLDGKPEIVVPDGPAPTELVIDDLVEGEGNEAAAGDHLVMHYVGVRHSDGGEFDASWNRGTTFDFVLGQGRVIQGWDQGIVGMKEGGRRLLSIPAELAYGDQERGADIPANSALVFLVDLLSVSTPPTVENAPTPVTELEVTVLEEGNGAVIEEGSIVQIHYRAVLQTTGDVFASSWESGQPATFEVNAETSQLPAWDIGLPGLRVGDVVRMVIPPGLGIDDPSGQVPADATIITEMKILAVVG
jgi:peptidylprolyl isomerase